LTDENVTHENAVAPARTACHTCRGTAHANAAGPEGVLSTQPVVVPGDGELVSAVMTQLGGDAVVTRPCPECGESDDPGWVPGFVIPV
jgi:hypothetical protein